MTKTTEYRTKRKQKNEANASEAEDLINEYLESFDRNSNLKTKKILDEYLEKKNIDRSEWFPHWSAAVCIQEPLCTMAR